MQAIERARRAAAVRRGRPRSDPQLMARNTARTARAFWVSLHGAMWIVLAVVPSDLQRWVAHPGEGWGPLFALTFVFILTLVAYLWVADSDPGFVAKDEQPPVVVQVLRGFRRSNAFLSLLFQLQAFCLPKLKAEMLDAAPAPTVRASCSKRPGTPHVRSYSSTPIPTSNPLCASANPDVPCEAAGGEAGPSGVSLPDVAASSDGAHEDQAPAGSTEPSPGTTALPQGEICLHISTRPGVDHDQAAGPSGANLDGLGDESDSEAEEGLLGSTGEGREVARYGRECIYCQQWQPLRSKHCHQCARCVRRFDHHCFWVGTCVGQNNHGRFWCYLTAQTALIVCVAMINNTAFVHRYTVNMWVQVNIVPIVVAIVLYCFAIFVLSLWALHTYLILTNQTTWEVSKRYNITYLNGVPDHVTPFNHGIKNNIREYCCGAEVNPEYILPTEVEIRDLAEKQTIWNNKYYSCC